MEGLEEKLGAVLNNPLLMQQLMSMAQSLGNPASGQQEPGQQEPGQQAPVQQTSAPMQSPLPDLGIDIGMLQKLGAMAQGSNIDQHQRALLSALTPYLHDDRISRLEKAMRAARLARAASSAFAGGIPFLGR